jgi:cytochrome c nitrite reductase small subunit
MWFTIRSAPSERKGRSEFAQIVRLIRRDRGVSLNPDMAAARRPWVWIVLAAALGVLLGIAGFTFRYAEGLSYFSTDPKACVNCHIMQRQYDGWQRASHHGVATCNDCHMPTGLIAKLYAKAANGYHHSKGFTFQDFHEPIRIKPANSRILQDNCLRCHEPMVEHLVAGATTDDDATLCVQCHAAVGHGETAGLGGPRHGEELPGGSR